MKICRSYKVRAMYRYTNMSIEQWRLIFKKDKINHIVFIYGQYDIYKRPLIFRLLCGL